MNESTVRRFCKRYKVELQKSTLEKRERLEVIEMKFHLTEIKPIHANWITQFYNHMSIEDGSKVVINGWKRSGIVDAVTNGSAALPSIDPFQNIAPLPPSTSDLCESETLAQQK